MLNEVFAGVDYTTLTIPLDERLGEGIVLVHGHISVTDESDQVGVRWFLDNPDGKRRWASPLATTSGGRRLEIRRRVLVGGRCPRRFGVDRWRSQGLIGLFSNLVTGYCLHYTFWANR